MLVKDIAIRVKRQFGDQAGAQISDEDIYRWINDAQIDIAAANDLFQNKAGKRLIKGESEYLLPYELLQLRAVKFKGNKLRPLSMEDFDNLMLESPENRAMGTPEFFYVFAGSINLFPVPENDSDEDLYIYYTRRPREVSAPNDIPELPQEYHTRIVEYCIAQAAELDDNLEHYQLKMGQFKQGLSELKDNVDWEETDYYPSVTVSIEDYA